MAPVASILSREAFAAQLLFHLGASGTRFDAASPMVKFVVAWEAEEGMSAASNNPLATTMRAPGSVPLPGNKAGVQQFPDLDTALGLAVRNLSTPLYANLRHELIAGTPESAARALQQSGWCGGPKAPCPGYGAKVLGIYAGYQGSAAKWSAAADHPAGTVGLNSSAHALKDGALPGDAANSAGLPGPDAGDAARQALESSAGVIAALGSVLAWLSSGESWRRIGLVAGGATLLLVGLALIKHDTLGAAARSLTKAAVLA